MTALILLSLIAQGNSVDRYYLPKQEMSWIWGEGEDLYHVMWDRNPHFPIGREHENIHHFKFKCLDKKGKPRYGKPNEDIAIWKEMDTIYVRYSRRGKKAKLIKFTSEDSLFSWLNRKVPKKVAYKADSIFISKYHKEVEIIDMLAQIKRFLFGNATSVTLIIVPIPPIQEMLSPLPSNSKIKFKPEG